MYQLTETTNKMSVYGNYLINVCQVWCFHSTSLPLCRKPLGIFSELVSASSLSTHVRSVINWRSFLILIFPYFCWRYVNKYGINTNSNGIITITCLMKWWIATNLPVDDIHAQHVNILFLHKNDIMYQYAFKIMYLFRRQYFINECDYFASRKLTLWSRS
jgi:hypothetical protein